MEGVEERKSRIAAMKASEEAVTALTQAIRTGGDYSDVRRAVEKITQAALSQANAKKHRSGNRVAEV